MKPYNYIITPSSTTGRCVEIEEGKITEILTGLLSLAVIDEPWYLARYPDVANAIKTGSFRNGKDHYVHAGYFENRLPRPITVNEKWYLVTYPDVAEAVRTHTQNSASDHFFSVGFLEGRLPYAGWSLLWDQEPIISEAGGVVRLLRCS